MERPIKLYIDASQKIKPQLDKSIMKVEINGNQIENYETWNFPKGIFIHYSEIENKDPVLGKLAIAYYCDLEQGDKKWKVQVNNKKLSDLINKTHLKWFLTREECQAYILEMDQLLKS